VIQFQLFRVRVRYPPELPLFGDVTIPQLIKRAIEARPTRKGRKGATWHVGNVEELVDGLYFALGRTTKAKFEKFDEKAGNFIEESFETAPYTHVLVELTLQICAIAAKPKVAPSTGAMARRLAELMSEAIRAQNFNADFTVDALKDPASFIDYIRSAYAVQRFAMTFRTPNPWDVERDFQNPLQQMLREAHGEQGRLGVAGSELDPTVAEKLARAAASTGDEAEAVLVMKKDGPRVRRVMRKEFVSLFVPEDELASTDEKTGLVARLREMYQSIRDAVKRDDH
jgi:hypothetical protein